MNVVIIDRELNREKKYQIMYQSGCGFNHVYAGNLFTLEQAKTICKENNLKMEQINLKFYDCLSSR